MKRRNFIKLSLGASAGLFLPDFTYAEDLDLSKITFSADINRANNAQTIIIFLYGGASQLAGNLSNLTEIENASQNSYSYFSGGPELTKNKCWESAGGVEIEKFLANGDMTLFRTCYSKVRDDRGSHEHLECIRENQRGSFDGKEGMLTNLARILERNGIVNQTTRMPFVTFDGDSEFYATGEKPLSAYLRPIGLNTYAGDLYAREGYGEEEIALFAKLDALAQQNNTEGKMKDVFSRRSEMRDFVDSLSQIETPDLGEKAYPGDSFAEELEMAVKLLTHNPDTKVATLRVKSQFSQWDHDAGAFWPYFYGSHYLFETLESAMAHIKAEGKEQNINIMVFSEFGRDVNLNNAKGWNRGNLQNFYVLGGKGYFKHKGVVGETVLDTTYKESHRLYLKPKPGSYWFEPMSIAATLYKIYGIENPEVLTGGYDEITPLFS